MKMYSEADVDATCLADRRVAILGYGSQGRAHALNLKDSGFKVVMGLRRDGASWASGSSGRWFTTSAVPVTASGNRRS